MADKFTSTDIDKWLEQNQKLMDELASIEEKDSQPNILEKAIEATHKLPDSWFGKETIFPIEDDKKTEVNTTSKFQEYYNSEEGNKKEYIRRRTPKARWAKARHDASRRYSGAKEFSLTFEQYKDIISKPCEYCNSDISQETGSGLDRIDNDKGYILGNVNPCCGSCNQRRSKSMSADEFKKQSLLNGYWHDR